MKLYNINDCLYFTLNTLDSQVITKNDRTTKETKEILNFGITCIQPRDRILRLKHRNSNIVAQIAETLWVLSGSDDLRYILPFLPRAIDYSDNPEKPIPIWRAAYGPRIRGKGIFKQDQLKFILELLKKDPSTRQASIAITFPKIDIPASKKGTKDYPCTQVINFILRDGYLHCRTVMRSNDSWFGFSGINFFEFTFLQEIMAGLLSVKVGTYQHAVSSMHLYSDHFKRAKKLISDDENIKSLLYRFEEKKHIEPDLGLTTLKELDNFLRDYKRIILKPSLISFNNFKKKYNHLNLLKYASVPILKHLYDSSVITTKFVTNFIESLGDSYLATALKESKFFI